MEGILLKGVDPSKFSELCETVKRIDILVNGLVDKSQDQQITPEQIADELGITKQTVYNYIKSGNIKAQKIGRKYLIKRRDLNSALQEVKSLKYKR